MRRSGKPVASLSLDLDNLWSYLKTHGDVDWEQYPTYLDVIVPLALDLFDRHNLKCTFFLVGRDVVDERNLPCLREIVRRGHEIGNHSFNHEPWMQEYDEARVEEELGKTHAAIVEALGASPVGFRGPGFCYSPTILRALAHFGYSFDASLLPSVLGPLARLYYFANSTLSRQDRNTRKGLFGKFRDGFQPIRPFVWNAEGGGLLEIPVTTMPLLRLPFHLSYLIWLSRYSKPLSFAYLDLALMLCSSFGLGPSFLMHPLDLLGQEDAPRLGFFPGMDLPRDYKLEYADRALNRLANRFELLPMSAHARRVLEQPGAIRAVAPTRG